MKTIDIRRVTVGGEIGRRIDITANHNMMAVDLDKDFILPFQTVWDGAELGDYVGMGKFIDALSRVAAYLKDEDLIKLNRRIVNAIIDTQEESGYIGIMPPEYRIRRLWDIHEMSYMILGLTTDYHYWKEPRTFDALTKLADYLMARWQEAPPLASEPVDTVIYDLGSDEAFLALYEETKDRKYLDFVTEFKAFGKWDREIVKGRHGKVEGHVYDYFCRTEAQLRLFRLKQANRMPQAAYRALDFIMNQDGMAVTGGIGIDECWHDTQEGKGHLGETCATAYQIRFMHTLLQQTENSIYGDFIERMIYNALFAAQSPDGRNLRYYAPFEGEKKYFWLDTYCCPNNFRRILSELPGMLYYLSDSGFTVNLYTPSSASLEIDGGVLLHIRQETDYPKSGSIKIYVDPETPITFALRLRIPSWCNGATVLVNGRSAELKPLKGSFYEIHRNWRACDVVELELPMPFRLIRGRALQEGKVALMRGPVLFSLSLVRNPSLKDKDIGGIVIDPASLTSGEDEETIRLNAQVCRVQAWAREPGSDKDSSSHELSLILSEFPDPNGVASYFSIPPSHVVETIDDELINIQVQNFLN